MKFIPSFMLLFLVGTGCHNHQPSFIDLEADKLRLLEQDIAFVENLTDDILTAYFLEGKSSREIYEKFDFSEIDNRGPFANDAYIDHLIETSASLEEFISKLIKVRTELKSEFIFDLNSEIYERIMVYTSLIKMLEFDYPDTGYSNLRSGKNCAAGIFGGALVGGLAGCRAGVEIGALFASPMKGCIGGAILGALGGGLTGSVAAGCWD